MNDFAQLSGDNDTKFLLRWRGRQEGPYPASVVESKLAANEIGLLHEINYEGKWYTIRDYIAERKAVLRAEFEALEEQKRQAREEAEQQARAREEQRQGELLNEERRRVAQIELLQSSKSQINSSPVSSSPPARGSSGLRIFGILLLFCGLAVTAYFFFGFDTSVQSGVGRVHNLGLLADRQNGVIIGIGVGVVGAILLAVGFRGKH